MLHALSAATSALDLLKSLTAPKVAIGPATSRNRRARSTFPAARSTTSASSGSRSGGRADIAGHDERAAGGAKPGHDGIDRSASTSRTDALKDLFAQIDADSDGKLSKSEFENALGAGGTNLEQADSVFGKMDKDGDGAVSLDEMMSALKGKGHRRHDAAGSGAPGGSGKDTLMQALEGASSTSVANSDGSVDDIADLCRRLQGDDDIGRGQFVERGDVILQFHRADDPAPGPGGFIDGDRFALGQRLSLSGPDPKSGV